MVTFETKVWENDWEVVLKSPRLATMIARNDFSFAKRQLIINNVKNHAQVEKAAQKLVCRGVLTNYYIVAEWADKALDFFRLSKDDLGQGYNYSIAELVGLYHCTTPYLLHYSSDAILSRKCDWVSGAIKRMEQDSKIKVANACWNKEFRLMDSEIISEDDEFYLSQGFSDQCYLVRTADFRQPIYGETNAASERYPKYGGELFEKRVDAWLRNHDYRRLTSKQAYYNHRNIPRELLPKWLRQKFFFNF